MKHKLAEGRFLLAVIFAVGWLGGIVSVAVLSVMGRPEHDRLLEVCTRLACGGEVPVLLVGWLYHRSVESRKSAMWTGNNIRLADTNVPPPQNIHAPLLLQRSG